MKNLSQSVSLHFPQRGKMVKILQSLIVLAVTFSLLGFPQAKPVNAATTVNLIAFADTLLRQGLPTSNYGGATTLQISPNSSARNNALFLWDVTSIPRGATVTSASLTFYVSDISYFSFDLYQMRRAWVEGVSNGQSSNVSANWNTFDGSTSWGEFGARSTTLDRYDTNLWEAPASTFLKRDSVTILLNSSGVDTVQSWINSPSTNFGFTVQCINTGSDADYWAVYSSEATPAAYRPILNVTYEVIPTITTNPAILAGFSAAVGQTSAEQSYTLTGSNLGANPLLINAPPDFQISTTSGSNFNTTLSLTPTNGSVSSTVFVRLVPSSATTYSNLNITHVSGTASANVAVSGSSVPVITTQGSLTDFSAAVGIESTEQSYTVSGNNLTSAITITPPAYFLVSTTSGGRYSSSLSISPTAGTVAATPVYVVFNRPTPGSSSGNISHTSTGSETVNVVVNGTVIQYYSLTAITSPTAGSITLSPPGGFYPAGTVVTVTAVANTGFAFSSWSGDLSGSANPANITIDSNKTITANFLEGACTDTSLDVAEDTYIRSGNLSSLNYGGSSLIRLNPFEQIGTSDGQFTGALLKWDFSNSAIPANALITAASLRFNVTDASNHAYQLYNLRRNWIEGDTNGNTGSGASWNFYDAGNNAWGTAGAQSTSTDRDDTNLWNATAADFNGTGSRTFNLNGAGIGIIQGWVQGDVANYGLTIQNYSGAATDIWTAYSSEYASVNDRPRLNLTYCIPSNPTIKATGALSAFSAAVETPSAEQSFTVSAVNLNGDLHITTPESFEISTSSGGIFTSSLTLTPISGIVAGTPIFVRFRPAEPGAYSGNITLASEGATTILIPVNGSTINSPPSAIEPLPANGISNVATPPTLSVKIIDLDQDLVNVSYYGRQVNLADPEPFELIGTVAAVSAGSTASVIWTRSFITELGYEWYTVVDDGLATMTSSIWSFSAGEPTGVDINYFRATKNPAGVQLAWETVSEATLAGFNLYRRELDGEFIKINEYLIPPEKGGQPEGFAYSYVDDAAALDLHYRYRLEVIETNLEPSASVLTDYWPYSFQLPMIRHLYQATLSSLPAGQSIKAAPPVDSRPKSPRNATQ